MKHPIMPWIVRHSAYIVNRYATHANGFTSFYNRWHKEQHTPLCEFGETRFFIGIWLRKDTTTGESLIGIYNKILRARTIRRQIKPHKCNQQLFDVINMGPWNTPASALTTPTMPTTTAPTTLPLPQRQQQTAKQHKDATTSASSDGKLNTGEQKDEGSPKKQQRTQEPTSPMATAPPMTQRPALPMPTSSTRPLPDEVTEGSASKQQKTTAGAPVKERPTTGEQPQRKMRINAMTVNTRDGKHVETTSNQDPQKIESERILLEPILHGTEGLDPTKVAAGMKKEIQQMKEQGVYTEIDGTTLTTEQWSNIVESRWVLRPKQQEVRARMVAKGYTENISDNDLIYASAPLFCILRILLTMALSNNWSVRTGDVSVAFLHAPAATLNIIMRPPPEFYDDNNKHIMWKLNKAIYGLSEVIAQTMARPHSRSTRST